MSYSDDSDEEYGPVVGAWGDQAPKESDVLAAWNSLADPNVKLGPNGLGTGNLHRRGKNFKPIDEKLILEQRLKGQVPKEKMIAAVKKAERELGLSPSSSKSGKKKGSTPPSKKQQPASKPQPVSKKPPPAPQKTTHELRTLRPPPTGNNPWTSNNLVDVPFWEKPNQQQQQQQQQQPKKEEAASNWQSYAQGTNNEPSWGQQQPSWINQSTPQQTQQPGWANQEPAQKNQQPAWMNQEPPQQNQQPSWMNHQEPSWMNHEQQQPSWNTQDAWNNNNNNNNNNNTQMPAPSSQAPVRTTTDHPPRPERTVRPPPGLFKNAISQIANESGRFSNPNRPKYSKPPGLSPIPLKQPKVPQEEDDNPVVITINIELETGKKQPVRVRVKDNPEQLAQEFSRQHNIQDLRITRALCKLFTDQKELAIKKRNVNTTA